MRTLILFTLLLLLCPSTQAQCNPGWAPGEGIPGVDGTINAVASWDDGTGPVTVFGGVFGAAGKTVATNIALWNGAEWKNLGTGVGNRVNAIAAFQGKLYAGMDQFLNTFGPSLLRWNGATWEDVGPGLTGHVYALLEFNGELIVGGWNLRPTGIFQNSSLMAWNGSAWRSLVQGGGRTYSLTTFQNKLVLGGNFSLASPIAILNIATWDGTTLQPIGQIPSPVNAVVAYNGELYAGTGTDLLVWDGAAWTPRASGVGVNALSISNNELVVGGIFSTISGIPARCVAAWNGSSWRALGTGMSTAVKALAVVGNKLFAGGEFTTADGIDVGAAACLTSNTWQPLGTGFTRPTSALAVYNSELLVGSGITLNPPTPGGFISAWNGTSWRNFASGFAPSIGGFPTALCFAEFGGELIVGGTFSSASGVPAANIAAWNGQNWHALGAGVPQYLVRSLCIYNNELIVGGEFTTAGGLPINNIAAWNGTSWRALGTGTTGGTSGTPGRINQMIVVGGNLIAVGSFDTAGGVPARNVASWDGTAWHAMGAGIGGAPDYNSLFAIALYNGSLYAGGHFAQAGVSTTTSVAKWNGTNWVPAPPGASGDVYALTVHDSRLYAAGNAGIAALEGTTWRGLGTGLARPGAPMNAYSLATFNNDLYVGGNFTVAGGQVSSHLARWTCTCYANCDASVAPPVLNANDFQCFLNRFAAGNSAANCDGSTAPPTLNAGDFQCFLNAFAAGCP